MGYHPSKLARALVSGRTQILGLIVSDLTNPFFPEIIQSFENAAVELNYEILLVSTRHNRERMETSVRRMIERRVDGVAVLTSGMKEKVLRQLQDRKVPLVLVDTDSSFPGASNLRVDYQHGIRQAVQHLAALRHRRIAFITGPLTLPSALTRKRAFENALDEIRIRVNPHLVVEGDHTMEGGRRAFRGLIEKGLRPTAIMCSNDISAIGVMREAFERGVKVPEELSVIGFDDVPIARFTIPPLTSIRISGAKMGRLAFEALMAALQRERCSEANTEYVVNTEFVLRGSTALVLHTPKAALLHRPLWRRKNDPFSNS